MTSCCEDDSALESLRERQRGTLHILLAINAVMFVLVASAGIYGHSTALLADSLDNLGDALTYGLSLYAVTRGTDTKAKVALFKGVLILLAAVVVGGQIVYKLFNPALPLFVLMGVFSILGLIANGACLMLLWKHREEDVNMSSVWECSRNDIVSNVSVFVAAAAVWFFESGWPDVLIATALVFFLLRSSIRVIRSARLEMQNAAGRPDGVPRENSDGLVDTRNRRSP